MRKVVWSAYVMTLFMVGSSVVTGVFAAPPQVQFGLLTSAAPVEERAVGETLNMGSIDPTLDVRPLVKELSNVPGFADWKVAEVKGVRKLRNQEAKTNAILWDVQTEARSVGYLVTTPDGTGVYEFSRRAVPEVPAPLRAHLLSDGYLYVGPALHLGYIEGELGLELYNLLSGETLPTGELRNWLPDAPPILQKGDTSQQLLPLPVSRHEADHALYATGRYGQWKLGETDTGEQALQNFAQVQDVGPPSYLVYDAIPDKLYITMTLLHKVSFNASTTFFALQDPFAEPTNRAEPIYIDSSFPVSILPVAAQGYP